MKRTTLAILAAAVALFLWGFVSWTLLPWHRGQMKRFTDEKAVAAVIKANTPEPGLYLLPGCPPDASAAAREAQMKAMGEGPYLYGVARSGSKNVAMGPYMAANLLSNVVIAALLALLMSRIPCAGWSCRVKLGAVIGLLAGFVADVPTTIWFEFPAMATVALVADHIIACILAALVIGAVSGRKSSCETVAPASTAGPTN